MKRATILLAGCIAILAFGSVVAIAQTAPQEPAAETQPVPEVSPFPEPVTQAPASNPNPDVAPDSVEDAPVDIPSGTQSDWAPDINLDAQNQSDVVASYPQRKSKPRKVLSDAGENMLGTGSWSSASTIASAQAQLLARANRRERAVDPLKRSDLTKLSRVMGALHALRVSCSGRDDQTYRSRMATMLDLEAPDSGEFRDPLVDAFNGGFQAYGRGASACPADARVQEASLAKDGFGLARSMSVRYRPVPKVDAALPPATQPRQNTAPPVASAVPIKPQRQQTAPPRDPAANTARPSWNNLVPN